MLNHIKDKCIMYCMSNYDPEKNYYNCIYLLVDTINKTYYCGRAENLKRRLYGHTQNKKTHNKIFILEQDCQIMNMEYVWLHFFKNTHKVGWKCLNKDFNTGIRFKTSTRYKKIVVHDLYESRYYKWCKEKVLEDSTGLITNQISS